MALWESGYSGADWGLFLVAAVAALLIHVDAHLWNDIMDLDTDRREKSSETGRDRPLLLGWATVSEYKKLSAGIILIVVILVAFLTVQRPLMPVLLAVGLFFDYGYNHPRIALAYRPFTEYFIFPWLVVGVTVTAVYAATARLSWIAFILSLLHGMTATCFVVSMMRRDAVSDRLGGKRTAPVLYPALPHSTVYGIVTLLGAILAFFPLVQLLGNAGLAFALVLTTAVIAVINTALGLQVDRLSARAMNTEFPAFEGIASRLVLLQSGAALVHAAAVSTILLAFGGIV